MGIMDAIWGLSGLVDLHKMKSIYSTTKPRTIPSGTLCVGVFVCGRTSISETIGWDRVSHFWRFSRRKCKHCLLHVARMMSCTEGRQTVSVRKGMNMYIGEDNTCFLGTIRKAHARTDARRCGKNKRPANIIRFIGAGNVFGGKKQRPRKWFIMQPYTNRFSIIKPEAKLCQHQSGHSRVQGTPIWDKINILYIIT